MNIKPNVFIGILILFLVYGITSSYYKFFVSKEYLVITEVSCVPGDDSCFTFVDPETGEKSYYGLISKVAKNIPICDESDEDCAEPACEEGELDCKIIICNSDEDICE